MVLQHSDKKEHYKLANKLCQKAIDLKEKRAKWLYAATLDRYLLASGAKYQKFGTQYVQVKGKWKLFPINPKTTDVERKKYDVPTLGKLKKRVENLSEEI